MSPALAAQLNAWAVHDAQAARSPRACRLCSHGTQANGARCCTAPQIPARKRPQPVAEARQRGGACGPEATLMSTPWLTA